MKCIEKTGKMLLELGASEMQNVLDTVGKPQDVPERSEVLFKSEIDWPFK